MIEDKNKLFIDADKDFVSGFDRKDQVKKYVFGDLIVEKDSNGCDSHFRISESLNEDTWNDDRFCFRNINYPDYLDADCRDPDDVYYQSDENFITNSILGEEFSKVKAKRRSFKIEYINSLSRRRITFSKRKKGLLKKAEELAILTGTEVLCIVMDNTGEVSWYRSPKMISLSKICQDELVKLRKGEFS